MAFQCHVCGKEYNNKFNFNYHVAHHFDARPFTCDFDGCPNSYKTKADLRQHQKSHEKAMGLNFFCTDCGANFDSSTKLNVHMRESHYSKGTTSWCELCKRHFANYRSHYVVVHEKRRPFSCDIDGKSFSKMHGLVRHIEAVHLKMTPFPCTKCKKKFKEASALKKHLTHHIRIDQSFKSARETKPIIKDWSEDEEIVAEKLRFKCGSCYRRFSSKGSLQKHELRVHVNAKYVCDVCGQRFESKINITRHIVNKHSLKPRLKQPTEQMVTTKLYKCGACKKIISSKNGLERHKRLVHLAIYDFMCEHCSATFRDRGALNKHLEKYHQLKRIKKTDFDCFICGKSFVSSYILEKHETSCRLKKQEILNRELDLEANFFPVPEASQATVRLGNVVIEDYSLAETIELDEIIIKTEPVEYIEQLDDLMTALVEDKSNDADPFNSSEKIKSETEEYLDDEFSLANMTGEETQIAFYDKDEFDVKDEPLEVEKVVIVNTVMRIECKSCPKLFSSKDKFFKHFQSSHANNECESKKKFTESSPNQTQNEMLIKEFRCLTRSQLFTTVEDVKKHHADQHTIKEPHNEVIQFHCVHCPQLFNSSWQLQKHFSIHHHGRNLNQSNISKTDKQLVGEQEEENISEGEPENIDEESLVKMFRGKTFNDFSKVFECKICPQMFSRLQLLKLHCTLQHRIKKFKCNHCVHSFGYRNQCRTHWGQKHAKLSYKESFYTRGLLMPSKQDATCRECLKTLSCQKSLKRHIELVHDADRPTLYCDQCADTFRDFRTLQHHVKKCHTEPEVGAEQKAVIRRRKTTKPIECDDCGEIVYGTVGLLTHRWNKHFDIKIVGKKRFHCLICKQVMNCRVSAMRHHVQVHNRGKVKVRTCQECETDFGLFEDFKRHIEIDHGSCFICLVCGMNCGSHVAFIQHKKLHLSVPEDEKKLACDLCGFKAQQKVTIEAHMVRDHGALKKKYFATCEYCGITFSCYQSFNTHRKTHRQQTEVKFKCSYCDRAYYNMRELRNHEGSHTNPEEKPYRCEFEGCNREYVSYSSFRWHFKYSHKENRNQCKACSEILTSRDKLIQHCEEKHPELRRFICNYCGKSFASQSANIRHMKNCEPTTVD